MSYVIMDLAVWDGELCSELLAIVPKEEEVRPFIERYIQHTYVDPEVADWSEFEEEKEGERIVKVYSRLAPYDEIHVYKWRDEN